MCLEVGSEAKAWPKDGLVVLCKEGRFAPAGGLAAQPAAAEGPGRWHLCAVSDGTNEADGGGGSDVFVVVVIDGDDGRIDARTGTLDLDEGKEAVRGRFTDGGDADLVLEGAQDGL